ncbi:MAG: hypothetical protein WBD36_10020 [Bacteroidota bacterium]
MDRIIKLELSANRKKVLLANDLVPAIILLMTGLQSVKSGTTDAVTVVNIVSGGLLVIFGLREWRSLTKREHGKIQWYDFVSGIVMMLNAVTMYKSWKGFQPAYLYFLAALLLILKALSIIKPLSPFRRLTISDAGFTLKLGLLSTIRFRWEDIVNLKIADQILHITTIQGDREVSLKRIADTEEMSAALSSSMQTRRTALQK